jgi:hypothetical protein
VNHSDGDLTGDVDRERKRYVPFDVKPVKNTATPNPLTKKLVSDNEQPGEEASADVFTSRKHHSLTPQRRTLALKTKDRRRKLPMSISRP